MKKISSPLDGIVKPLKQCLPIQAFTYVHYRRNGRRSYVTDHPELTQHLDWVFQNTPNPELPETLHTLPRVSTPEALVMTTDGHMREFYEQMIKDLFANFPLGMAFSILQRCSDGFQEFIFFPDRAQSSSYNTLFAHQDLLTHFAYYFLDKAQDELAAAPLLLTCHKQDTKKSPVERSEFLASTDIQRYFLDHQGVYLTRKEGQCASLLAKNLSSTQIAEEMSLSKRTIEDHINRIKFKLNADSKNELVSRLIYTGIGTNK